MWNGGWVLVRREHVLTPTQKKVSLFLFFSFSLFFSTFPSVVSLLLSSSSSAPLLYSSSHSCWLLLASSFEASPTIKMFSPVVTLSAVSISQCSFMMASSSGPMEVNYKFGSFTKVFTQLISHCKMCNCCFFDASPNAIQKGGSTFVSPT